MLLCLWDTGVEQSLVAGLFAHDTGFLVENEKRIQLISLKVCIRAERSKETQSREKITRTDSTFQNFEELDHRYQQSIGSSWGKREWRM